MGKRSRVLSDASVRMDLPSVHVPSGSSRVGKAMCNAARGYLRTMRVVVPGSGAETFLGRVQLAFAEAARRDAPTSRGSPSLQGQPLHRRIPGSADGPESTQRGTTA